MRKQTQGNLILLITAIIWGTSFVAQRAGMDYVEPFTFIAIRSLAGGLVLIPVLWFFDKRRKKGAGQAGDTASAPVAPEKIEEQKAQRKVLFTGGVACGLVLFVASSLQQVGFVYGTTAGKAGFITALYVVLVPLFGLFARRKVRLVGWCGVVLSIVGLYLLCIHSQSEGFHLQKGDFFVLLCAFAFAGHILVISYFSPKTDGIQLSCIQFFVCGIVSLPVMFLAETPKLATIAQCWLPLLYAGVLSCGVAYTLQVVAQKYTEPTVTSILLSLESVFAVIAGGIILHEALNFWEVLGCVLMFAAVIMSQLPSKENKALSPDGEDVSN